MVKKAVKKEFWSVNILDDDGDSHFTSSEIFSSEAKAVEWVSREYEGFSFLVMKAIARYELPKKITDFKRIPL